MITPTFKGTGSRMRWGQPSSSSQFGAISVDAAGTYAVVRFRSAGPVCPMVLLGSGEPDRIGPKGPEFRSSSVVRAVVLAGRSEPTLEHEVTILPVSGLMPGCRYHLLIKGAGHRNAVASFTTLGRRIEWWFDAVSVEDASGVALEDPRMTVRATGAAGSSASWRWRRHPDGGGDGPALMLHDEDQVSIEVDVELPAEGSADSRLTASVVQVLGRPGPAENYSAPFQVGAGSGQRITLAGRVVVSHG